MTESWGTRAYRWAWTIFWALLAAVGGSLNVTVHGWSTTIGVVVVMAALSAGFYCNRPDRPGRKPHDGLPVIMGLSAIVCVSIGGWVTALGLGALMLPIVAVLSWTGTYRYLAARPRISAWLGRVDPQTRRPSPPEPPTTPDLSRVVTLPPTPERIPEPAAPPAEPPTPVTTLTDEQLCQAWRASFRTLEQLFGTSDTAQQAQLISRRQQYLDELEHRNPHGFARWLASGARPAGDPSRFL